MKWLNAVRSRLRLALGRRAAESRMEEEFEFHLQMETEANRQAGFPAREARRRALVAFGGVDRHREWLRDDRGARWLEDLAADLRYATRRLRRAPGFAAVAILTLGLGIGSASAIFSVAYGILFRSLPYDNAEQLVRIYRSGRGGEMSSSLSAPDFMSLRGANRSFTDIAIYDSEDVTLTGFGEARWLDGAEVSAGFFEVMGTRPMLGRTFIEGENLPGADDVAVISHALWRELSEGSAAIVGQTLTLHERPRTIVGVMPAGFDFPYGSDVWIPLEYNETYSAGSVTGRRNYWLNTVARLNDGVTPVAARTELALLAERLEARFPQSNTDVGFAILPLREALVGSARTPLFLLLAAVGLLLVIACANVAGLFLARAASRHEELAVRVAIGAGRTRLMRQLMTESLLVGSFGGLLGLLLATWATQLIVAVRPDGLPRIDAIRVDATVFAFGMGLTLLTVLLAGLIPAWQATRAAVASTLREGGTRAVVRSGARVRAGLVTAELALAVILLSSAGLLLKSFTRVLSTNPGFRTEGALAFLVRLPESYGTGADMQAFFDELLERIEALPGVERTGAVFRLPVALNGFSTRVSVPGSAAIETGQEPLALYRSVTPGYFEAMGIPVLDGRGIAQTDQEGASRVVVINETAARLLFPGEQAVGQHIYISAGAGGGEPLAVVGTVADVVDEKLTDVQEPEIFLPFAQASRSYMHVVVRSGGDPLALIPAMRRVLRQVDPNVPGRDFRTLDRILGDSLARERYLSTVLGVFASAALLLAAIGIFGLFSFTVAERTREMAVRTALGARRTEVVMMVLADALKLTGVGLALGAAGAVAASRFLEGQLHGVSAMDPATFGGVIVVLAITAIMASLLPARRAAAVDPMTALRRE